LRVVVAVAVPLLQAEEGAEGAEEYSQTMVVAAAVEEEEEEEKEKNPHMKVEGVAKH
jgi:hypothetical protein